MPRITSGMTVQTYRAPPSRRRERRCGRWVSGRAGRGRTNAHPRALAQQESDFLSAQGRAHGSVPCLASEAGRAKRPIGRRRRPALARKQARRPNPLPCPTLVDSEMREFGEEQGHDPSVGLVSLWWLCGAQRPPDDSANAGSRSAGDCVAGGSGAARSVLGPAVWAVRVGCPASVGGHCRVRGKD
jgi:hypothetical protein